MAGHRILIGLFKAVAIFLAATSANGEETNDATAAVPVDFSVNELELLDNGDPIVRVEPDISGRNAAAHVFGAIKINASLEDVWATMVDCDQAPEFVPNLISCEIIEAAEDGAYDIRKHIITYSFIGLRIENIFRSDYKPYSEIAFKLVGGDLERQEGVWSLGASDEGEATLVIYDAYVALGKPVPRFLVRRGMRKDMPKVLLSLREQVLKNKDNSTKEAPMQDDGDEE